MVKKMGWMNIEIKGDTLIARSSTGNKQWVAKVTGTSEKYLFEREFVAYQKPRTSKRASGMVEIKEKDVIEKVSFSHSGKTRSNAFYQVVKTEDGLELEKLDLDKQELKLRMEIGDQYDLRPIEEQKEE